MFIDYFEIKLNNSVCMYIKNIILGEWGIG